MQIVISCVNPSHRACYNFILHNPRATLYTQEYVLGLNATQFVQDARLNGKVTMYLLTAVKVSTQLKTHWPGS